MKFNKAKNKVLKYDKLMQKRLGSEWAENGFAENREVWPEKDESKHVFAGVKGRCILNCFRKRISSRNWNSSPLLYLEHHT